MSQLGIGYLIWHLSGGSDEDADKYYGRKITAAKIEDNELLVEFSDGIKIKLWDNGQSCCENRYITCDDDVSDLVGGTLVKIEVKQGEEKESEWGEVHEWVFVNVATDKTSITLCTHNEHNGYYGGFGLSIREVKP